MNHVPRTREQCRAAAIELTNRGFTTRDISEALRITPRAVEQLMGGAGHTLATASAKSDGEVVVSVNGVPANPNSAKVREWP